MYNYTPGCGPSCIRCWRNKLKYNNKQCSKKGNETNWEIKYPDEIPVIDKKDIYKDKLLETKFWAHFSDRYPKSHESIYKEWVSSPWFFMCNRTFTQHVSEFKFYLKKSSRIVDKKEKSFTFLRK